MRTETPFIAGAGLFALDVIVRLDGSKSSAGLGGSAGNVLSILGALGWSAAPVGVLGDDPAARMIYRDFERVGADTRLLRRSGACSTPVIFQHQLERSTGSAHATHRFTFACPSCGARRRPQWDDDPDASEVRAALPQATVFYLDRPTRLGVELAEGYARQGAAVVFEPSAVGDDPALFARAVRCAQVVKYADERIGELSAFDMRDDAVEIQTRGARGLRFRFASSGSGWTHLPAFALPFIHDTAGAGDWTTAGLLFDLFGAQGSPSPLQERNIGRSLAFGQILATLNCMTEGARGLLFAWPPEQIVETARSLADLLLQTPSMVDRNLNNLVDDFDQAQRFRALGSDSFYCCAAL